MSLYKQNVIEKPKTKNRLSQQNYEKNLQEEKEHNISTLANIKVFNGLVKAEKDIFKTLNNKKWNKNTNNRFLF